jgi:hypothetical protein
MASNYCGELMYYVNYKGAWQTGSKRTDALLPLTRKKTDTCLKYAGDLAC